MKKFFAAALCAALLTGCGGDGGEKSERQSEKKRTERKQTESKRTKQKQSGGKTTMAEPKQWESPPEMSIDPSKIYVVNMETNRGGITLELYPEHAPKTVNNFVFLAGEGFYDGVTFHRVIRDFVIQGGDPSGTGAGGPGYRFEDETAGNPLVHAAGVISMANAGPDTNGSQFFITHAPQPHLNGRHTVFGKVTSGMDIVLAIKQGDVMEKVTAEEE